MLPLPRLEQLTLSHGVHLEDPLIVLPHSHPTPLFPSLREINITLAQISVFVALVEAMSSSPLTSITFDALTEEGPLSCQDLVNALRSHCHHSVLTSITINVDGDQSKPTYLKPLFTFSNLTHVDLFLGGPIELDDVTVRDMALAWPRIKSLILNADYPTDYHPSVTILGLVPIAQHCLELQMLTILFDARSLPLSAACFPEVTSKALKKLDVLSSPIVDSIGVAAVLYHMFPGAVVGYSMSTLHRGMWQSVCDIGKFLRFCNCQWPVITYNQNPSCN